MANGGGHYGRGSEKIMDSLHGMGHRKLGVVGHHAKLGPINERLKSVLDIVRRYGDEVEVRHASSEADTLEGGRAATHALLGTGYRPTALICANDVMAVGAL